jgi:hypothetical protein
MVLARVPLVSPRLQRVHTQGNLDKSGWNGQTAGPKTGGAVNRIGRRAKNRPHDLQKRVS